MSIQAVAAVLDDKRNFTSWKMGWINALVIGLEGRELRLAICLLQFAGSNTKAIFPSQARVAAHLGCNVRTVERGVAQLVRLGWLERRRPKRHLPNAYRFVESKRDEMEALLVVRLATFKVERWGEWDPVDVSGPDDARRVLDPVDVSGRDPVDVSGRDPVDVSGRDPVDVSAKHLKKTPRGNTDESSVSEAGRGKTIEVTPALAASKLLRRVA